MNGVSTAAAASAAGISEVDLSVLEATGQTGKRPDFHVAGESHRAESSQARRYCRGWLPAEKDMSVWRELRQISTTEGGNAVHCYFIWDEVTRDGRVIRHRLGCHAAFKLVEENQLQLKHLFITHTHADHVAACNPFVNVFPKFICTRTQGRPAAAPQPAQ